MRIVKLDEKNMSRFKDNYSDLIYSSLFDNLSEGICIIDEFGYIEYINNSYKQYFSTDKHIKEGTNIYKVNIDNIVLNCFSIKKYTRGVLVYFPDEVHVEVAAWPRHIENKFKGVIVIYRKIKNDNVNREGKSTNKIQDLSFDYNIKLQEPFKKIIGESRQIKEALLIAQKASEISSTVLLRGESGTGKELVARAIHYSSNRSNKPFVAVNCGAIPSNLLESELFGHEQGAFTGAVRLKIGKFERADGGTVFLDEIGDLPKEMQVKLLRVLQEREFERIGGMQTIKTDVRIIAATNRNLEEMVYNGEFREDLYYRLNVIPIYLPSLKERREDIPLLIDYFIDKISDKLGKKVIKLSKEAKDCLYNYDWSGNIRELENVIERLIALSDKSVIEINDLPSNITNIYFINKVNYENSRLINLKSNGEFPTFEEYEKEIIKLALEKFKSFNSAGKALGITHKTVAYKARKYNIVD
ncbi:sigma-54-dependent Fis family transcriptional regulator [Caloranaerobacter sp. TR13]|uniref:sigma-54 interaction domain-containing protein n=1 Tax=Caloranaerobacter sp. TR13 TaxID=1302151 RepID=UPI0006D3CEAB|nr:sigma 54-interacting transcriptional regulator [Caloranaerobacter sp. TR13]